MIHHGLGRKTHTAGTSAVCVGLPSSVDQATRRALNPVGTHGWTGEDMRAQIAEVFDGPVLVDNDVNLMAYGERTFVYPEAQHLIFVKLATGVGAGVIAVGALQPGAQGFAGDIGHVPLLNSGRPCPCGNTGCVSLTASVPGLAASLRETGRELETDAEVVDLVTQGDPEAQRLLRQAGRDVGEVMVAAVGLLNPSRLVIGGPWGPGSRCSSPACGRPSTAGGRARDTAAADRGVEDAGHGGDPWGGGVGVGGGGRGMQATSFQLRSRAHMTICTD